jgi:probable rRNA maturation factor
VNSPAAEVAWDFDGPHPLTDPQVERVTAAALEHGDRAGWTLSVVFVDDARLAEMHDTYLGDSSPTDVLTFDLGPQGEGPRGELYVSVERAEAMAVERGVTVARELALYVVHGALHLCGFDDSEPQMRASMRVAEREVMAGLGFAPDEAPHDRS